MRLACLASATFAMFGTVVVGAATAVEPQGTVPKAQLAAAVHCHGNLAGAAHTPVLLLPGSGSDGSDLWPSGFGRELSADRVPSCFLDLPGHTTADMQTSAEYVVFALRRMARRARQRVGVYGFSQGGVLARLALTYWPSTRRLVSDVVSAAAPQHGSTVSIDCAAFGCSASAWQRRADSRLIAALNGGDESPGRTAWTTLRTLDDGNAQPVSGTHPTSVLDGARNLLMQRICPGRHVEHLAMAFDAVAYAVLRDATTHPGPARVRRLPRGICRKIFVGELELEQRRAQLEALNNKIIGNNLAARRLAAEPPVRLRR